MARQDLGPASTLTRITALCLLVGFYLACSGKDEVSNPTATLGPEGQAQIMASPSNVRPSPSDIRPQPSDIRPQPSDIRVPGGGGGGGATPSPSGSPSGTPSGSPTPGPTGLPPVNPGTPLQVTGVSAASGKAYKICDWTQVPLPPCASYEYIDEQQYVLFLDRTGFNVTRPFVINAFNSDFNNGSDPFLRFTVNVPADVYVFTEDPPGPTSCTQPSWLSAQGFRNCCGSFLLDHPTKPREMTVWSKAFLTPGQITLGPPAMACSPGAYQHVMYIVDVVQR